ncbi:hypothetical protein [Streptomyces hoynatensis]|uniref:Secreted protein n=1 Tax=Streptomyces hoynatensis TaxID=1141874 RepID=A0A3A9YG50_9ACTN|nr:hypothetical protein [Streptomyces hoynatensis]RKN35873.1 hypothetical protein D7294_30660 [Streptomyces hoynatensis]
MALKSLAARSLFVATAGAAALALNAGTAHADSYEYITSPSDSSVIIGVGQFTSYGDELEVCDSREDGHAVSVAVYYSKPGSSSGQAPVYTLVAGGYGTCSLYNADMAATYNLTEGHTYWFSAGYNNSTRTTLWSDVA